MIYHLPFRNVLYYRLKKTSRMISWLYKRQSNGPYIAGGEIKKGLFFCHGFSTMIGVNTMGENCWINQQVTIGYVDKGVPTIGNNVSIYAWAIILGEITIGDNSIIGAGAVVLKNVPADCMAYGNPMRIIRIKTDSD
jgi:serine O-acetyltransferase